MKPRAGRRTAPDQLGARVRKARHELGLSLAAVAGKDFSRAFLNLVELGKARPSTRTLQIIAERLQRPIEYFLQDAEASATALELALTESQTRLHRGDTAGAEALLDQLLKRHAILPEVRTRAQLILAEAWLRRGAVENGMALLHEAITAAERGRWRGLLVELYDRMGSAHYLRRRFQEAGRWWDKALQEYEAAGLTDPLLRARILGHQANILYSTGTPADAIAAYESAIAAAEQVLDMKGLAGLYEGLAMSLHRAGQQNRALEYAQRSLRLFETVQDLRMSAQLHLNMADILLQEGRAAEAERLFNEGAVQLERVGDPDLVPYLISGAAEAALEQGALDRAEVRMAEALAAVSQSGDPLARAATERIAGRITHALGRPAESRTHFERALEAAASFESPRTRSRIAYDYARVLEAQGDTAQAATRFREAYETQAVPAGA